MTYGLAISGFSYPSTAQSERYKRENYGEYMDNVEENHRQKAEAAAASRKYKALCKVEKDIKNSKRRQHKEKK